MKKWGSWGLVALAASQNLKADGVPFSMDLMQNGGNVPAGQLARPADTTIPIPLYGTMQAQPLAGVSTNDVAFTLSLAKSAIIGASVADYQNPPFDRLWVLVGVSYRDAQGSCTLGPIKAFPPGEYTHEPLAGGPALGGFQFHRVSVSLGDDFANLPVNGQQAVLMFGFGNLIDGSDLIGVPAGGTNGAPGFSWGVGSTVFGPQPTCNPFMAEGVAYPSLPPAKALKLLLGTNQTSVVVSPDGFPSILECTSDLGSTNWVSCGEVSPNVTPGESQTFTFTNSSASQFWRLRRK